MPQPKMVNVPAPASFIRSLVKGLQHIRGIPRLVYLSRHLLLPSVDQMRLVNTPEGFPITINPDDYAQLMQFYFPYSPELQMLLQDLLLPGDVCVDCGANTGLLTAVMSDEVGIDGLVIAVDPNPENIRLIQNTVSRCQLSNIQLMQVGVAGKDGTAHFAVPPGETSESGDIRPDRADGMQVRLTTIHSLMMEAAPGRKVNFIKYDIEGAEAELIESLQTLLNRGERPALLVEFHPKKIATWGGNPQVIRETLWSLGYEERHVEWVQGLYRLRHDKTPLQTNANILFLHPEQLTQRSKIKAQWSESVSHV